MIFPNHQYSEIENTEALDNLYQNKNDSDNFLRRLANAYNIKY
jgi:phage protein D